MIRDRFYRQIVERLSGQLDPQLFEDCAVALLRSIYPTIVPIRGGSDSGMDGAIADGLGEPFPLVTTTSKNVIGNLTRNLQTYIHDGGQRRKAVLATSQSLTPQKIRNLNRRATDLGFILIQVHEQADIADRLHRSPEWCRELLDLTGNPPALSAVPLSSRPLLNTPLVGRGADLEWLRQTQGDRLLVGQPGTGKTFLLNRLVMDDEALFVVSSDRAEIAAGLRSQHPPVIIVDDAQGHEELLLNLRQMRNEIGADFSIVASCWPGDSDTIANVLSLAGSHIRQIDLLTRDEIVEVIHGAGVSGPNELVREIVNQAEGRPGLAVTLAQICLQGGVREVVLGEVLRSSILRFIEPRLGHEASIILAAFAVGGDSGMAMLDAARALGFGLVQVREAVVKLATGGVITDINRQRLSVRPPALRHALVRDVFFRGAFSVPIEPLLIAEADPQEKALTLIGAKRCGASVPVNLMISLVERANSNKVWTAFAWLGREEALQVIQRHPEIVVTTAAPILFHAPESILPLLLAAAIDDQRQLHSTPEHPLRIIHDWICETHPGDEEVISRRRVLLEAVEHWLSANGESRVGFQALKSALIPSFEYHSIDPGSGYQVTLTHGYVSIEELRAIQGFWPRAWALITRFPRFNWQSIRELVEIWAYPGRLNVNISGETYEVMRSFAVQMLQDIVSIALDRPGVLHWAKQVADNAQLNIPIPLHREFEILYPERDFAESWREVEQRDSTAVRELAQQWSVLQPEQVVTQVIQIEMDAREANIDWPRWTPFLCGEIASQIAAPSLWVRTMIALNCTADLVQPFLQRSFIIGEADWPELAFMCLNHPQLKWATISLVLTSPNPPSDLLEQVLSNLQGYAKNIEIHCFRSEIAEHIVLRLLQHPDPEIASAAAEGEWHAEPQGTVRITLQADWRQVVIDRVRDDYFLSEVFPGNPDLAYLWLSARLRGDTPNWYRYDYERAIYAATNALDVESKRNLLHQIPERYQFSELVGVLVDSHLDLYRELLSIERLRDFHLVPLAGNPEGVWHDKALIAIEAGYSAQDVSRAVYGYSMVITWTGNESQMWSEWIERFDRLCSHEDERIRQVGEAGKRRAHSAYESALRQERREAIYGMW